MLRLRRPAPARHLTCAVEFAAGSNHAWPWATVEVSPTEDWQDSVAPEVFLLPLFARWLTRVPDAYDRFYGRCVNGAMMELLGLIAPSVLESEEKARSRKDYGLPLAVLRPRVAEWEEVAARALLALVPEVVGEITGPSHSTVVVTLQTREGLEVSVRMPPHEPERGRRKHPEKSLVLASCALIAVVDDVCMRADYERVVVPAMRALRDVASDYETLRVAGK